MLYNSIRKIRVELLETVESLVQKDGLSYLEAITHFCTENEVDEEQAAKIVSNDKTMTAKLEVEAEDLNLIKRTTSRLPI